MRVYRGGGGKRPSSAPQAELYMALFVLHETDVRDEPVSRLSDVMYDFKKGGGVILCSVRMFFAGVGNS